jgi:hypothetical protein
LSELINGASLKLFYSQIDNFHCKLPVKKIKYYQKDSKDIQSPNSNKSYHMLVIFKSEGNIERDIVVIEPADEGLSDQNE